MFQSWFVVTLTVKVKKPPLLNSVVYSRIILSSGVNDEPVLQEGKSKESIGRSRSVFSTPTIPTGNHVTKSVNKPHYPKSFGNGGVEITRYYANTCKKFY